MEQWGRPISPFPLRKDGTHPEAIPEDLEDEEIAPAADAGSQNPSFEQGHEGAQLEAQYDQGIEVEHYIEPGEYVQSELPLELTNGDEDASLEQNDDEHVGHIKAADHNQARQPEHDLGSVSFNVPEQDEDMMQNTGSEHDIGHDELQRYEHDLDSNFAEISVDHGDLPLPGSDVYSQQSEDEEEEAAIDRALSEEPLMNAYDQMVEDAVPEVCIMVCSD